MTFVVDEEDGERAIWKQWTTMGFAMRDHRMDESLNLVWWKFFPKFASECDVADIDVDASFLKHLTDKSLVHRGLTTMGVQMTSSEFHGFA